MEGARPAGSYPTNAFADLTYTNYLGVENCVKHTVSPVLPWKSANVSYGFYLVDENGKPIVNQTTGETGSFANAVLLTDPVLYKEVMLNSTGEVDSSLVVKSDDVLPEGYELYDPNSGYTITIGSGTNDSNWSIDSSTSNNTTYVTGFNGSEYSNELTNNDKTISYTNTTVWFAIRLVIKCVPDAVVIDYGLPVDIQVLENDMFGNKGKLVGVGALDAELEKRVNKSERDTTELDSRFGKSSDGKHGSATFNAEDGLVRYTPTMGHLMMDTTDIFAYAVHYTGETVPGYYYGSVKVIPAANIYYEDTFLSFTNGSPNAKWEDLGTPVKGATQSEDRPGTYNLDKIDADNVYGYDPVYNTSRTYSLGAAKTVTVSAENNPTNDGTWPTVKFKFKGTGFDIISLTNNVTGTIFVEVAQNGTAVKRLVVDTYYGCTFNQDTQKWEVDPDSTDSLYQVPVMKVSDLDYGTYDVTITVQYSTYFDHGEDGKYEFIMDAVRIYNPAGVNGSNDKDANDAYKEDNEAYPFLKELRNMVIEAGVFNEKQRADGFVFVDGYAEAPMSNYEVGGPNNEVYLQKGQGIAFFLRSKTIPADVQIGAKLAFAESGVTGILNLNGSDLTLETATNMFYSIGKTLIWSDQPDENGYYVTQAPVLLFNEKSADGVIISLTDIKWTFATDPDAEKQELMLMSTFALAEESHARIRSALSLDVEQVPAFQPEKFEMSWLHDDVVEGEWAILTLRTSEDVERITVNGTELNRGRPRRGVVTWTYTMKAETIGTNVFEIFAYDAEGVASEPVVTQIHVQEVPPVIDWVIGWLKGIFGR